MIGEKAVGPGEAGMETTGIAVAPLTFANQAPQTHAQSAIKVFVMSFAGAVLKIVEPASKSLARIQDDAVQ